MYRLSDNSNDWPTASCIYKIVNEQNGDFYIGSTNNLKRRLIEHRKSSKNSPKCSIHKAIQLYSSSSFTIEIVSFCDRDHLSLIDMEQQVIDSYLDVWDKSYNMCKVAGRVDHSSALVMDSIMRGREPLMKAVNQYDLSGDIVETYKSLSDAEKAGFDHSKVSMCCNRQRKTAYGFQWRFVTDCEDVTSCGVPLRSMKVDQYDKDWNYITTFESFYQAAKETTKETDEKKISRKGNKISQAARGLKQSAYGFRWKAK